MRELIQGGTHDVTEVRSSDENPDHEEYASGGLGSNAVAGEQSQTYDQ